MASRLLLSDAALRLSSSSTHFGPVAPPHRCTRAHLSVTTSARRLVTSSAPARPMRTKGRRGGETGSPSSAAHDGAASGTSPAFDRILPPEYSDLLARDLSHSASLAARSAHLSAVGAPTHHEVSAAASSSSSLSSLFAALPESAVDDSAEIPASFVPLPSHDGEEQSQKRVPSLLSCSQCGAGLQFRRPTSLGYLPRARWHRALQGPPTPASGVLSGESPAEWVHVCVPCSGRAAAKAARAAPAQADSASESTLEGAPLLNAPATPMSPSHNGSSLTYSATIAAILKAHTHGSSSAAPQSKAKRASRAQTLSDTLAAAESAATASEARFDRGPGPFHWSPTSAYLSAAAAPASASALRSAAAAAAALPRSFRSRRGPALPLAAVPASVHWAGLVRARACVVPKARAAAAFVAKTPLAVVHRPPGMGKTTMASVAGALWAGKKELFAGDLSEQGWWDWEGEGERVVLRFDFALLGRADDPFDPPTLDTYAVETSTATVAVNQPKGGVPGVEGASDIADGAADAGARAAAVVALHTRPDPADSAAVSVADEPAAAAAAAAAVVRSDASSGRRIAAEAAAEAFAMIDAQLRFYEERYCPPGTFAGPAFVTGAGAGAGAGGGADGAALEATAASAAFATAASTAAAAAAAGTGTGTGTEARADSGQVTSARRRDFASRLRRLVWCAAHSPGSRACKGVVVIVDNYDAPLVAALAATSLSTPLGGAESGAVVAGVPAAAAREHTAAAFLVSNFMRGLAAASADPLPHSAAEWALRSALVLGVQRAASALAPLFAPPMFGQTLVPSAVRRFEDATFSAETATLFGATTAEAAALVHPLHSTEAGALRPWAVLAEAAGVSEEEAAVVMCERAGGHSYPPLPTAQSPPAAAAKRWREGGSLSQVATYAPWAPPVIPFPALYSVLATSSFSPRWAQLALAATATPRLRTMGMSALAALWAVPAVPLSALSTPRVVAAAAAADKTQTSATTAGPSAEAAAAAVELRTATTSPPAASQDESPSAAATGWDAILSSVAAGLLGSSEQAQLLCAGVLALAPPHVAAAANATAISDGSGEGVRVSLPNAAVREVIAELILARVLDTLFPPAPSAAAAAVFEKAGADGQVSSRVFAALAQGNPAPFLHRLGHVVAALAGNLPDSANGGGRGRVWVGLSERQHDMRLAAAIAARGGLTVTVPTAGSSTSTGLSALGVDTAVAAALAAADTAAQHPSMPLLFLSPAAKAGPAERPRLAVLLSLATGIDEGSPQALRKFGVTTRQQAGSLASGAAERSDVGKALGACLPPPVPPSATKDPPVVGNTEATIGADAGVTAVQFVAVAASASPAAPAPAPSPVSLPVLSLAVVVNRRRRTIARAAWRRYSLAHSNKNKSGVNMRAVDGRVTLWSPDYNEPVV